MGFVPLELAALASRRAVGLRVANEGRGEAGQRVWLGVIDNPFGRTEAEERLSLARHRNIVRAQARDSFNGGATWDTIAASLKADNPAYIPEDLRQHYRL